MYFINKGDKKDIGYKYRRFKNEERQGLIYQFSG